MKRKRSSSSSSETISPPPGSAAAEAVSATEKDQQHKSHKFDLAAAHTEDPYAIKAEKLIRGAIDVFDPQTGALGRELVNFHGKQKRRFGKTADLDDHPLLDAKITVIIAPTGGGKTNLLLNLLQEAMTHINPKKLGRVMLYTGSPQDKLIQKLNPEAIKIYSPQNQESFFTELADLEKAAELEAAVPRLTEGKKDESDDDDTNRPLNFILLDDIGNSRELAPERTKGSDIGRIYMRHRHLPAHIIVTAQRVNMLPVFVRQNCRQVFMFPGASLQELNDLNGGSTFRKERLEDCYRLIRDNPHEFIWLDKENRTIKRGFSTVLSS